MIAKNYLSIQELKVLNNLVSAYFDLAGLNAIEEKVMTMSDYVRELDNILSSAGRKILIILVLCLLWKLKQKQKLNIKNIKLKR